mgnify:CR=1 FL=1
MAGRNKNRNNKNTRNPDNALFRQLTKLLSGPMINYRTQTARRLRRRQLDQYARRFRSASGQQFKKTEYNPFDNLMASVMQNQNRLERYVDFDQMEYTPEIASALDIYADEMTTSTNLQPLLTIKCSNDEIKNILEALYHNILNIDFNLFGWCRTMCKYGDYFLYLDIDETVGIQSVIGLPTQEIERLEGEDKTNPNYVQYQWNSAGMTFENWQMAHFRILGNDKYAPYGTSVLEASRRIWRQLTLLEDAMMSYRIVRSPERRVFYVDVGGIPPQDVEQYMQKVMTQMKRNQVVDPSTGRVDLRYNPMSIDEDYFIPVRGQTSSKVESLPGGTYTGDIDDVKYLRDKLFSSLKIPPSYLSQIEGAQEDKTTLAQKDIRFARTIQRLQRSVVTELEKIGIVHLYVLGFRGEDLTSFKLALSNPSKIAELQELEHWKVKFDTASAATEGFFSKRWISEKLFNISEEEFVRIQREMFYDRKFDATLETAGEAAQAAMTADAGLGGDAGLDDLGEPGGTGAAGLEPELGADAGGAPDAGPAAPDAPAGDTGADSPLLAAPGKRDEDFWNIPDSRGRTPADRKKEYDPVKSDSRGSGARKRSYASKYSRETASSTRRNTLKGFDDIAGLKTISNGVYEGKDSNYHSEENLIHSISADMKRLIENLEQRNKDETETQ